MHLDEVRHVCVSHVKGFLRYRTIGSASIMFVVFGVLGAAMIARGGDGGWESWMLVVISVIGACMYLFNRSVREYESLTPEYGVFASYVHLHDRIQELLLRAGTYIHADPGEGDIGIEASFAQERALLAPFYEFRQALRQELERFGPYPCPDAFVESDRLRVARVEFAQHISGVQEFSDAYSRAVEQRCMKYGAYFALRYEKKDLHAALQLKLELQTLARKLSHPVAPPPNQAPPRFLGGVISLEDARAVRALREKLRKNGGQLSAA